MSNKIQKKNKKSIYQILITMIVASFIIFLAPVVQADTEIKDIDQDIFNRDYWEWHTRTTTNDKAYNGEHIQIKDNAITFYGYGQTSYKDLLYKEFSYAGKKTFRIIVDEKAASYHTLEGAGFLINSAIKDGKLSGYAILYAEKTINVYRIDDVNLNEFKTKKNMKVSNYGTLVKSMNKKTSGIHNVIVETTPTYIKVTDNDQIMNIDLDPSKHVGDSFGLISSYLQHDCKILTKIVFEKFEIEIENYTIPVKTMDLEERPLSGASYEVKNEEGKVLQKGTSTSEGIFAMEGLQEGIYTVNQTSAPSGYKPNTKVIKFKVTNEGKAIDTDTGEEIEIVFINELIPKKEENNNTVQNTIENTVVNTVKPDEDLPDRLPQTGVDPIIITFCITFAIAIMYFAIKIKKYDFKE